MEQTSFTACRRKKLRYFTTYKWKVYNLYFLSYKNKYMYIIFSCNSLQRQNVQKVLNYKLLAVSQINSQ